MATSSVYYLNAPSLGSATAVFTNSTLATCAADGFYSDGVIVREQVGCVLLPQQTCPTCDGVSYNCVEGICTDPGDGTGTYATLVACQAVCGSGESYNCIDGVCVDPGDGSGTYATLGACESACNPEVYTIDSFATGTSFLACTTGSPSVTIYALPGYTVPIVTMIFYTDLALTTPFVGGAGWRKFTNGTTNYAGEVDATGELTNYVTC
jgi:hypothetical protein